MGKTTHIHMQINIGMIIIIPGTCNLDKSSYYIDSPARPMAYSAGHPLRCHGNTLFLTVYMLPNPSSFTCMIIARASGGRIQCVAYTEAGGTAYIEGIARVAK